MALLDAKFVALAKKLLDKFGMSAQVIIRDEGVSFNESTGTRQSWSDNTYQVKAVPPSIAKDLIRDGSNETSAVTFITPLDIASTDSCIDNADIKNCDTFITSDGTKYKVLNNTRIYSGDQVALIRLDLE